MEKLSAWLFLLIGIIWLLDAIKVNTDVWGMWVNAIALIIIGITEVMKMKEK